MSTEKYRTDSSDIRSDIRSDTRDGRASEPDDAGKPEAPDAAHLDGPSAPGRQEHEVRPRRPRGFAVMDRALVRELARKGGRAAHSAGTAHQFTSDEARLAGRKGGRATHQKRLGQLEQRDRPSGPPGGTRQAH
jgi:general stress protein YciG